MNIPQEDRIISRIASNDAASEDWSAFETIARSDRGAWERLARELRDELAIRSAALDALDVAEDVEIPDERLPEPVIGRISGFSGWAAAAMVALAWIGISVYTPDGNIGTQRAGPSITFTADSAYDEYMRTGMAEGRVIEELPSIMVESRHADGDRIEVYYIRQLLERAEVNSAYQMFEDEFGRATPVRIRFARDTDAQSGNGAGTGTGGATDRP